MYQKFYHSIIFCVILSLKLIAMIIGFSERRQTISESEEVAYINLAAMRVSERRHTMVLRLIQSSGSATVVPFEFDGNSTFDARFGVQVDDQIELIDILEPGATMMMLPHIVVMNDGEVEDEECFSIQVFALDEPGLRDVFYCYNDEDNQTSFFCQHTICIQDNSSKLGFFMSLGYIMCKQMCSMKCSYAVYFYSPIYSD